MKNLLLMTLLIFPFFLYSQCKYEINDVDPFTNKVRKETKEKVVWKHPSGGNSLSFKAALDNDSRILKLRYSHRAEVFTIREGSKLMLKLNDGKTIELICSSGAIADYYLSGSTGTVWFVNVNYEIEKADFETLKTGVVSVVRFYTTDGYVEKELKTNKQAVISLLLECL